MKRAGMPLQACWCSDLQVWSRVLTCMWGAGVLCAAAMMSTAGRVLTQKIDVMQLAFYTAPVSSGVLLPFFWVLEKDQFLVYAQEHGTAVLAIILCGSMVALAYNVVHNLLLQRTSSVAVRVLPWRSGRLLVAWERYGPECKLGNSPSVHCFASAQVTVLGEVKIVGLLILSAAILPGESSQFTARMTVGCVLAMLGFCLYSNARLVGSAMANPVTAAAKQKAEGRQGGVEADEEQGARLLEARSDFGISEHTLCCAARSAEG